MTFQRAASPRTRYTSVVKGIITVLVLLTVGASLMVAVFYAYPRTVMQYALSRALGRNVTIGTMALTINPLEITLDDIHVANAVWGSAPDYITVNHLQAGIERKPLLYGKLKFRYVTLDNATLLLERDAKGVGNWRKNGRPARARAAVEVAARSRSRFPTLLNLALRDSHIVIHTTSGAILKIDFKDLQLNAADEAAPVKIMVKGAYNEIPVHMEIHTDSYEVLHNVRTPFQGEGSAEVATAAVSTKLAMMDPLNFDQFNGTLKAEIRDTGKAAALFGARFNLNVPAKFESRFEHEGDIWNFTEAAGDIAHDTFNKSDIHLTEGKHKEPDALKVALNFQTLKVDPFFKPQQNTHVKMPAESTFTASGEPTALLDATITAEKLVYSSLAARMLKLHILIERKVAGIEALSAHILGGELHASLIAKAEHALNIITAKADLSGANAAYLSQAMHYEKTGIDGEANAHLLFTAQGDALKDWLKTAQGHVRLTLTDGHLLRQIVRIVSTDMRALLGSDHTMVAMPCALAVADFKRGQGVFSPFKVQTTEGVLLGAGTIDLPDQRLNVMFKTEARTTSRLALDIPIHVTGDLTHPQIAPSSSSKAPVDFGSSQNASCAE